MRMTLGCLCMSLVVFAARAEVFHLIDEHSGVVYGPFTYSNRTSIGVSARAEIHYFTILTESARAETDLPTLIEDIKHHRKRQDDIVLVAIAYYVLCTQTEGGQRPTLQEVERTVPKDKRSSIDFAKYEIVSSSNFNAKTSRDLRSKERMVREKMPDTHGGYYVAYGDCHVELIGKHSNTEQNRHEQGIYREEIRK